MHHNVAITYSHEDWLDIEARLRRRMEPQATRTANMIGDWLENPTAFDDASNPITSSDMLTIGVSWRTALSIWAAVNDVEVPCST